MSDECKPAPGQDLGRVLSVLRAARGLSKTDLASASGVPSSNLSQYELGNQVPELRTLRRLLSAMGFSLSVLEPTERFLAQLEDPIASLKDRAQIDRTDRIHAVAADAARAAYQWTQSCLTFLSDNYAVEPGRSVQGNRPEISFDSACEENPTLSEPPIDAWTHLVRQKPELFRTALEANPHAADPNFVEWLGARSVAQAATSPRKARGDAEKALVVAERLAKLGSHQLVGLAQAFVGNALRVANELEAAERAFALSETSVAEHPLPSRLEIRRLDLLASFRRSQQRFDDAINLLDRALSMDRERRSAGRLRLNKSRAYELRGDLEAAILELKGAATEGDATREPRLLFWLRHNLANCLSKLGRFVETNALMPEVRTLARKHGGALDEIRLRWIEGRIAAGLGRTDEATAKLGQVRGDFLAHGLPYDAALAALELATFYLRAGRTEQVKDLARQMLPVFQAHEIHREALAAITLFRQAAERECATLALAERVASFLLASRGNPALAFEGGAD